MTKRSSEKNKTWEKERRDRLNKAFDELVKLLPQYDPTVNWSKNDIIQKTIAYVLSMQEKHEKLLECHDPKALDDYKQLLDTLKFFRSRNSQLAALLIKAKITIPPAKFPKYIIENPSVVDENGLEFQSRPVGRPKKYSSLEKCLKKNAESEQNSKENIVEVEEASSKIAITSTKPTNSSNAATPADASNLVLPTSNAIISTGVLIPVMSCQPAILPQVNTATFLVAKNEAKGLPKCNILSIETLPRLNRFPKKLAKSKNGQVKILPNPVLRLHIRRGDTKVAIPHLKRDVITVKRTHQSRKRRSTCEAINKTSKKRKLTANDCLQRSKSKDLPNVSQNKGVNSDAKGLEGLLQPDYPTSSDALSKIDNGSTLPDNVLPDEYFETLQIPETNPNSTSVSPTAAFLLSFPVVNAGGGGKNVCETDDSIENHHQKQLSNFSDGLENLNSFFKSKDYYGYCSQGYDLSEKVLYDKITSSTKSLGEIDKFENSVVQKDPMLPSNHKAGKPPTLSVTGNIVSQSCSIGSSGKSKPAVLCKAIPGGRKDSNANIDSAKQCQVQPTLNPKMSSGASTTKALTTTTSSNQETTPHIQPISQTSKSIVSSSDFSMSSIFTSTPSTTSLILGDSSLKCPAYTENATRLGAPNSVLYPALDGVPRTNEKLTTDSSYSFNNSLRFPSASSGHSMKACTLRLTKINPIPNPIPAALPQPSNFPTNYSFFLSPEKHPLATANQYAGLSAPSISRGNFDVNSVFLNLSGNSPLVSSQASESSLAHGLTDQGKGTQERAEVGKVETGKQVVLSASRKSMVEGGLTNSTSLKQNANPPTSSKSDKQSLGAFNQTPLLAMIDPMPGFSNANNINISTESYSKTESKVENICQTTFPQVPKLSAATSCGVSVKDVILPESESSPKKSEPIIFNNKASTLFGVENLACQFPIGFPPTSNYGYAPVAPEPNPVFTFNLTPTSSTPATLTAGSCQSQSYFPYANASHLNSCPATLDFQTPFTFSLTSSSSTNAALSQANTSFYAKPNFSLDDFSINKAINCVSNASFNPFPELALPNTSYSGSSMASNPTLASNKAMNSCSASVPSCYQTKDFTFSLARPQTTITTATSEFMKPLASCSANEPKYQPFFNTYNYDSYSHVYPRETTTFTFALTNPTESLSSSQQSDPKASQRFTSSFSIDTTLAAGKPYSFQNQQIASSDANVQAINQNFSTQQKMQTSKPSLTSTLPTVAKSSSGYQSESLPQAKNARPSQKNHVNWMTSSQTSASNLETNQHCSFFSAYPTATGGDANDKNTYFTHMAPEDILPSWSPSKILDTSHLFQTAPVNSYYNEFNYSITSKANTDVQKPPLKPSDAGEKPDKLLSKPPNNGSVSSQGKFLSVSQLVDQNAPSNSKPLAEQAKKHAQPKAKDSGKTAGGVQNACAQQKVPVRNNYSAEALISKKDKHRGQFAPSTIHHLHNPDYYPVQNEPVSGVHPFVDSDVANYDPNYYYNFLPTNQSYVQDVDYLGAYPGDDVGEKVGHYFNRRASRLPSNCKINKKTPSTGSYLPNLTTPNPSQPGLSVPILSSALDSFETIQYSTTFQDNGSWNEGKNNAVLPGCNQSGVGNPGSNLTNFNLSTICPEISGKVGGADGNW